MNNEFSVKQDITGKVFGKWTALFCSKEGRGKAWRCKCSCGKEKDVIMSNLLRGKSKCCGCNKIEFNIKHKQNLKHGMTKTSIYRTWAAMINRCENPKNPAYNNYGGRGIKVSDEWRQSFETFYKDIGEPAFEGASLDRIDNNYNYCKENCRWADRTTQCRNTRTNRIIEFNGKKQCLQAWSVELSIPFSRLWTRIADGWSIEDAFTKQKYNRKSKI